MKNEFKVQLILEKVEILEVNVQDGNCLTDCACWIWIGNKRHTTKKDVIKISL
ncbi:TPA: hypothetical protein ACG3JQ_003141 [Clostridioides difficile]|nr:hypothetical protein [Clostridioides difficile]